MNGLLKNLLSHLTPRFQPSTPTDSGVTGIAPADAPEIPYVDEPRSAGVLMFECLRGRALRHRLPDAPRSPGESQREADSYFAITMAASMIM